MKIAGQRPSLPAPKSVNSALIILVIIYESTLVSGINLYSLKQAQDLFPDNLDKLPHQLSFSIFRPLGNLTSNFSAFHLNTTQAFTYFHYLFLPPSFCPSTTSFSKPLSPYSLHPHPLQTHGNMTFTYHLLGSELF